MESYPSRRRRLGLGRGCRCRYHCKLQRLVRRKNGREIAIRGSDATIFFLPPHIERFGAKFMTLGVCGGRKGGLAGANISLGVPGTFRVEPDDFTCVGEKMLGSRSRPSLKYALGSSVSRESLPILLQLLPSARYQMNSGKVASWQE